MEQRHADIPDVIGPEIHDEIVRLDNTLIPRRNHVRYVDVIDGAQCIEHIVSALIDCREWELLLRNLEQPKIHWPRRNESLVDKYID